VALPTPGLEAVERERRGREERLRVLPELKFCSRPATRGADSNVPHRSNIVLAGIPQLSRRRNGTTSASPPALLPHLGASYLRWPDRLAR